MSRARLRHLLLVLSLGMIATWGGAGVALAQEEPEGWSVVFTPQVWFSHIANNGFAGNTVGIATLFGGPPSEQGSPLFLIDSQPTSFFDPQWGGQLALQKGRWTLAAAAQYVSFTTRNDVIARQNETFLFAGSVLGQVPAGGLVAQEFVDTDRFDFDLSASYFFSDVVKDVLDINAGLGFKFIYSSATRNYANGAPLTNFAAPGFPPVPSPFPTPFTYFVCPGSELIEAQCATRSRVSEDDYIYAAMFPISFNFHLTKDKKWFLPLNVSALLGAETRYDHNVVYSVKPSTVPGSLGQVNRLDGTHLAYGVTADAGVRYTFDNGIALYGGFRVQAIQGFDYYFAWGPLVNMSVRFGK